MLCRTLLVVCYSALTFTRLSASLSSARDEQCSNRNCSGAEVDAVVLLIFLDAA